MACDFKYQGLSQISFRTSIKDSGKVALIGTIGEDFNGSNEILVGDELSSLQGIALLNRPSGPGNYDFGSAIQI